MTPKRPGLLIFSFVTLIALFGLTGRAALATTRGTLKECSEIEPLIRQLRSDETERETAKKSLLLFASHSSNSRQCVINRLLKIAAAQDRTFEFLKFPDRYLEWTGAIDILYKMRATEAIDTLIDCLECNDGRGSLSVGRYPAALVVSKFGEEAIPKLAEALKQKPPRTRYMAARVLHHMGGDKAKEVFEKAIPRERVKWIADAMKNMLITWHSLRSNTSFDSGR